MNHFATNTTHKLRNASLTLLCAEQRSAASVAMCCVALRKALRSTSAAPESLVDFHKRKRGKQIPADTKGTWLAGAKQR